MAISREAAGVFDGKNMTLYTYCHHNPMILVDPDGLWVVANEKVNIKDLQPEISRIENIVDETFKEVAGIDQSIVTSGKRNGLGTSKHNIGQAVDLRTRGILTEKQIKEIVKKLKIKLGEDYGIIYEPPGSPLGGPCIHIQTPSKGKEKKDNNINQSNYSYEQAKQMEKQAADSAGKAPPTKDY